MSQKFGTSLFLIAGLLLLAGVFSDARPALAQTQEPCPLPPGVTTPPDLTVTAQQVVDGNATLADFTRGARDNIKQLVQSPSLEQTAYLTCVSKQDDGIWRTGNLYLVALTPDGRILSHAKSASLTGRRLNPLIYGTILFSLGISPTDLANLASPDPATAAQALGTVTRTLAREPDGAFDATIPIPGLSPGIPGASGHAAVYFSLVYRAPILVIGGFDIGESHLVPVSAEDIDYGDPSVTARDVVDRASLKAFVAEVYAYISGNEGPQSASVGAKQILALRDPNGPWRHGSVYIYVLDRISNIILVHGAFPDRFEGRPLVPTVRDAVTGEFILPRILAAAADNPEEGGFVRYYFDDPADATDRADVPKVGYAREFRGEVRLPDGRVVPTHYVIGSGFYLSSPNVVAARHTNAVKSVLPQVMRAMTAGTVDAVSGRIEQANSGATPARAFSFGGAATLSDVLLANGQALGNGTFDPGRLLAGSSFTLPLSAAGGAGSGPMESLTLWGSADYRNISGGNLQSVDYDGDVVSAHVGVDTRLSKNLLAGMSVAWARGMVDYMDPETVTGELTSTLTSIHPYVGWRSDGGNSLWATAGHGWGEVEVEESTGKQESDLTQQMVAAGASMSLMSSDRFFAGGTTSLRLKGETAFTRADLDDSGTFESMKLYTSRQRVMFEGIHVQQLASGATFTPSLEFGMRYDGGDGETGRSLELGGGLRYTNPATGLTLEGRARALLEHEGDYDEWGVSGMVALDPGVSGLGLALSVQPSWGDTASGVRQMWKTGETWGAAPMGRGAGRVDARIAYGIGTTWGGAGVLTPYTDLSLSGAGDRYLGLGGRFDLGTWARMSLEGVHRRPAFGETDHGVMLRSDLSW